MENTEKKLGTWTLPKEEDKKALAQEPKNTPSEKKSDPICPSSGCPEPKKVDGHPVNYKVPDFGMDHDIKDSLKNMKDQEAAKGTWTVKRDADGKIVDLPTASALTTEKKPAAKQAIGVSADL